MGVTQLATDTVAVISPFLPALIDAGKEALGEAGKGAAERAGELVAESVWERARKTWAWVRGQPELKETVEELSADPRNDELLNRLSEQLAEVLRKQPALGPELHQTVYGNKNVVMRDNLGTINIS